jgi:hypothetical protein
MWRNLVGGRLLSSLALVLVAGGTAVGDSDRAGDARAAARPACFGAAARDPEHACVNRALTFTVIPSPYDAPLEPSAPCRPIPASPPACRFGVARSKAVSSVALLGDSHSTAWRAAIAVVADARQWHGVSINRSGCPFTLAATFGNPRCQHWTGRTLRWLRHHPEVHHVVVAANSGSGVVAAPGHTERITKINGYIAAWKALPHTVHEVLVLRDVPHNAGTTTACVSRAIARRRNPALRCARPREAALGRDEAAIAARRTDSRRVKLVDLSSFMCDRRNCFPVVGGALVIKDIGHLTRTFSTTLGPYLGRAITRIHEIDPQPQALRR